MDISSLGLALDTRVFMVWHCRRQGPSTFLYELEANGVRVALHARTIASDLHQVRYIGSQSGDYRCSWDWGSYSLRASGAGGAKATFPMNEGFGDKATTR